MLYQALIGLITASVVCVIPARSFSAETGSKSSVNEGRLVIYGTTQLEHMDAMIQGGIRYMNTNWDAIFANLEAHHKAFRQTFGLH